MAAILLLWSLSAAAGTSIAPGDVALRHDIQRLADAGVIKGTVSTWPLAWGPIVAAIRDVENEYELSPDVAQSLQRVRSRAREATSVDELRIRAGASIAEEPTRIRSFQDTPRESAELGGGIDWIGERLSVSLNGQLVESRSDGSEIRADGSAITAALGNYLVSVNTLDRWWGPGWDGSLILSNNARPIPAISIERNFTDAFDNKWLAWLGPWDLAVHFGEFESDRVVPNARFFGMRFNFRPIPSLEIGLSRSAQWCGEGRPCDLDTFFNLLLGRDNSPIEGVPSAVEPGNQMAGYDVRWAGQIFDRPIAVYAQLIGEDEAGGFPSRFLGQFGIESSGMLNMRWSYRWFTEFSDTSCAFYQSDAVFDCAYNHRIYRTGYRYRGRVVGHGLDNDSRTLSTGLLFVDNRDAQWYALLRYGTLNRGGDADTPNSVTRTRLDLVSIDLTHARDFKYGHIEIGLGFERTDDETSGTVENNGRAFLRWRSSH